MDRYRKIKSGKVESWRRSLDKTIRFKKSIKLYILGKFWTVYT